jgi:hypothetical protein
MNHQTIGDVSARIGALELGVFNAVADGDLEATIQAGPNAQVTLLRNSRRGCEFVDVNDDALEASALSMGPPPNATMSLQCLTRVGCSRIDDDALEATVQAGPQRPTAIRLPGGGCLPGADDGALEATVQVGPPGTIMPGCRRFIDDGALEQAAAHADVGPSAQRVAGRCY